MNEVRMLALSFFYYKMIDIEEARKLIIYSMQTLAEEINAEKKLRKYLYKYPFPPKRTEIMIIVHNRDYSTVSPEYISVVSFHNGKISYDITNPETNRLDTIYKETYEEALEKLAQVAQTIAENELSSMTRQCLKNRRMRDIDMLRQQTGAWATATNTKQRGVDWQFTIGETRRKLKSVYPKIKE